MKNKKILVGLLSTSTIAMVAPTIASCANVTKPVDPVDPLTPVQKEIFDIEGDTLKGFKSSASEQMIKDYCKDGVLRLPAVKTIGAGAFKDAPFGDTIVIDAGTTTIAKNAFFGNSASTITWNGTSATTTATISESAFAFCSNLTKIKLPTGVFTGGTIKKSAFAGCSALTEVNCANLDLTATPPTYNLDNWEFGCFSGISKSGTVKFINSEAEAKTQVQINGANIWSKMVYCGMNSTWALNDEAGSWEESTIIKLVPQDYFDVTAAGVLIGAKSAWKDDSVFNAAIIPSKVKSIAFGENQNIFVNKANIKTWMFNQATQLTAIPDDCFNGATSTDKYLSFADGITTIGARAFKNWQGAISLTPNKITSIGANAFEGTTITTFEFNKNITLVGNSAFKDCARLANINFTNFDAAPESGWPTGTGNEAFEGVSTTGTVSIKEFQEGTEQTPGEKISQWQLGHKMKTFFNGQGITFGQDNWSLSPTSAIDYKDIFSYEDNGATITGWAKNKDDTELTAEDLEVIFGTSKTLVIPAGVTKIKDNAFYSETTNASTIPSCITSIDLSKTETGAASSVTTIGASAFQGLPETVATITFPTTLVSIGNAAFKGHSFASIDLSGCTSLATIEAQAFVTDSATFTSAVLGSDWAQIGGDPITTTDVSVNATQLKDGATPEAGQKGSWGYTGIEKIQDAGRFNGKTWKQVAAACETFEASNQTTDDATDLVEALGFTPPNAAIKTPQAILEEGIVDSANNTGTVIINGIEHTVKCIGAMHDETADGKTIALTFQLFNVLTKQVGSHPIKPSSTWGVTDGDNHTYTTSVLYNNLVGTATWQDGTTLPNAKDMLLTGTPSLKNKLKTVKKSVLEYTTAWGTKTYSAPIFALTCTEVNYTDPTAEGTPYYYWTKHTDADRVFKSAGATGYVESYWLSSPNNANNNCAYSIVTSGSSAGVPGNTSVSGSDTGVVFAFCI